MKKLTTTFRPHLRLALMALAIVSIGAAVAIHTQRVYGRDQDKVKLDRFVQSKSNTASMVIFREGRDLIEAQNWQRAAEKFNDFIKGYPKDKDLDAALYWYGYALQRQGKNDEAAVPLIRLMNRFPNSSWRQDAQGLLVAMGRKEEVNQALARDNCEIKILALQSLFQADEERAIGIVMESLRANPSPCEGFKAAAVSMLGAHGGARAVPILLDIARSNSDLKLRLTAIKRLGDQRNEQVTDELLKLYDTDRTKEVRIQILRALIDNRSPRGTAKVFEIARAGDDLPIRQYAIRYLGDLNDAASLDELIRIYDADKTKEIRAQVLRSLAQREDPKARAKVWDVARTGETPEIRIQAIRYLGDHNRIAIDELVQLYTSETNLQIKQGLLRAFADNKDPRAHAKLLDIARGSDPIELRGYAIRHLSDRDDEQTVTALVAMFDAEQNPQVKMALMRGFGDSKHKVAVRKLMTIARGDQSVEMRKYAVRFLGESKDPEALKFLEELLK